jgi:ADP-heptose:LPS heptosyltransferase
MKSTEKRLLIIRSSAMGDVLLTVPLLDELARLYPHSRVLMVTKKQFNPFFKNLDLTLINPVYNGRHHGLAGIYRLRNDILALGGVDYVVDLHDVLRSKVLRTLFRLAGVPVVKIDKGRREKRRLLEGRDHTPLKHVTDRYAEAFARAGFPLQGGFRNYRFAGEPVELPGERKGTLNIGVAPYAMHPLKIWPERHMKKLLQRINDYCDASIYLFGGGRDECEKLTRLAEEIPSLKNLCGKFSLEEEISLMGRLDIMIAMDSSNMHLAALAGTRVVSVWGGTHPATGFGPMGDNVHLIAQIPSDTLGCRPCTIYGKGECHRGDFACMEWLTAEMVFRKIKIALADKAGLCNDVINPA